MSVVAPNPTFLKITFWGMQVENILNLPIQSSSLTTINRACAQAALPLMSLWLRP
jgi:hypothetical protein